jgi:hypothetical protein
MIVSDQCNLTYRNSTEKCDLVVFLTSPEAVDGHDVHDSVEAEESQNWSVKIKLGSFR